MVTLRRLTVSRRLSAWLTTMMRYGPLPDLLPDEEDGSHLSQLSPNTLYICAQDSALRRR